VSDFRPEVEIWLSNTHFPPNPNHKPNPNSTEPTLNPTDPTLNSNRNRAG